RRIGYRRIGYRRIGYRRIGYRRIGYRRIGYRRIGYRRSVGCLDGSGPQAAPLLVEPPHPSPRTP
ncbi:hypothetical protein, partial [Streptomyces spororaveus]|uniref:hypothetical protein n=1 Tax=Streptomyces spororaveus TaxID=284039 RepID=UPI0031E1B42E